MKAPIAHTSSYCAEVGNFLMSEWSPFRWTNNPFHLEIFYGRKRLPVRCFLRRSGSVMMSKYHCLVRPSIGRDLISQPHTFCLWKYVIEDQDPEKVTRSKEIRWSRPWKTFLNDPRFFPVFPEWRRILVMSKWGWMGIGAVYRGWTWRISYIDNAPRERL